MITLATLEKLNGNRLRGKRRGRGFGSGKGGHTTGSGTKGQKAREGAKPNIWFEGGQTPLVRKLPFIQGFKSIRGYNILNVHLSEIEQISSTTKDIITPDIIKSMLGKKFDFVKILGTGEIKKTVKTKGIWFTKKAKEKIEKAGGTVE